MKRSTPLFFLIVIALVVSLVALVSRQKARTPREVLEEVQAALADESIDEHVLLRHLASGLRKSHAANPPAADAKELQADLYMTRGRLLLRIGATDKARADFLKVLDEYRPGDREVRRLLIEAQRAEGETLAAVGHLEALLEDEPNYGPAWVEMGLLHEQLAEEALAICTEKLKYALVEEDALAADALLRKLAARAPDDKRRSTTTFKLRLLFPNAAEETFGQVLSLSEEASTHLAACRKALIRSFSLELDPRALGRYLRILKAAGQDRETLQLGSLVALDDSEDALYESAELLIRVLLKRSDSHHAAQLATDWINRTRPLPAPFLRLCCEALYRDGKWSTLTRAAQRLRSIGTIEDEEIVSLYTGLSQAHAKKVKTPRALQLLGEYTRSKSPEAFPGARAAAWAAIIKLHQATGNTSAEREALQATLRIDPDNGAQWLRRAEIQRDMKHGGYALPLDSWVHGMTLLPKSSDALMENFIALGERRLAGDERDLDVLYDELLRSNRSAPKRDYGPYVLWRIGQMHGEAGRNTAKIAVALRLEEKVPGFIPALDLRIEARRDLHDRRQYVELVLERVAMTGINPASAELLASLSVEDFTPEQLLEVMQLDPRGTGRLVVASWYQENGENALAIETLQAAGRKSRSDGERYFGAQVMLANGDPRSALRWLAEIPPGGIFEQRKLRLAVTASAQLNNPDALAEHLEALLKDQRTGAPVLLRLADELLRSHQLEATRTVLLTIRQGEVEDPGPLFLREVQLALASDEFPAAETIIERSGAFVEDAEYTLARLLLDSFRGDWSRARSNALELARLDFGMQPAAQLWLQLLMDREEEALETAALMRAEDPKAARWVVAENIARLTLGQDVKVPLRYGKRAEREMQSFLLGTGNLLFDPRQVAVLMLAAESEEFRPFVLGALHNVPRSERGALWPGLLFANLAYSEGLLVEASDAHNKVVRANPGCDVSWNELLLVTVKRFGSTLHPQVDALLTRRLKAQAKDDEESAANLLVQGEEARLRGDLNAALRATLAAAELAPDWFEAQGAKASLHVEFGQWDLALETWRNLVANAPPAVLPRALQGLIGALDTAIRLEPPPVPLVDLKTELDAIHKSHPGIPSCALALARLDLRLDPNNPAVGLERAWARLRRLRDEYKDASLESIERGSTRAWARFYVATDPGSAEGFIRSELQLQPGNLELWRLLGRVHRALGQYEEARVVLAQAAAMAPSVAINEELAATLVDSGAEPKRMEKVLQGITRGTGEESMEGQLLYAESLLNDYHTESWATAIEFLDRLWDDRHQLEQVEQRNRVAALLGRALLLRGEDRDAERAVEILTQQLPQTEVPYQREEFECLIGIGQSRSAPTE